METKEKHPLDDIVESRTIDDILEQSFKILIMFLLKQKIGNILNHKIIL